MSDSTFSYYTSRGQVFYNPSTLYAQKLLPVSLPTPPCSPRRRRPHSIHITRLPAGFVPFDLRPSPPPRSSKFPSRFHLELRKVASRENAKRVLGSIFSPSLASPCSTTSSAAASPGLVPSPSPRASMSLGSSDTNTILARRVATAAEGGGSLPMTPSTIMSRPPLGENASTASTGSLLSAPPTSRRASFSAVRPRSGSAAPSYKASTAGDMEKSVCSSGGIACYINLAEPVIFLTGLDHDGTTRDSGPNTTSLLRGKLVLNITKNVKIKAVTLKFTGRARTEWPEGIPPEKTVLHEEDSLRTQILPFFNAMYDGSENGYGTMCNYALRDDKSADSSVTNLALDHSDSASGFSLSAITNRSSRSSANLTVKEQKRLSLQSNRSRSFTKTESQFGPSPQQKGYKTFFPGVYEYNFELPIDKNSPETLKLPLASVKWNLEAVVERAGAFKTNLVGSKEIPVIRSPSEDSLELVEPISISRKWEDQLFYEIMISGKSFPLGSKIPIAFKLTPLAKVQIHKIKVLVSESVDYYARNKKIARRESQRKILLFEKAAGKPLAKEHDASEMRILRGGERTDDERVQSRQIAETERLSRAHREGIQPEPLPERTNNMLGDIDLGIPSLLGSTEMEIDVQLPTCEMMEKDRKFRLTNDCTWKNVDVHHWIKIVMRVSRNDVDDPTGKKRRHFEITIDSPISLLNCRATQANLALPSYLDHSTGLSQQHVCGCPNAAPIATPPGMPAIESADAGLGMSPGNENAMPDLARPPPAHLSTNAAAGVQRPIHLLRAPSFNPPPFDADDAPPLMVTPPPLYDHVFGTPSHDGLADYFARLSSFEEQNEASDGDESPTRATSRGRVNVVNPRTPGGRLARSMDIDRSFMSNPVALPVVRPSGPTLTVPGSNLALVNGNAATTRTVSNDSAR